MLQQHAFDFQFDAHLRDDALIVSACNEQAISQVEYWPAWVSPVTYFYGAKGSGKTTIAALWQNKANAISVTTENIQFYSESPQHLQNNKCLLIDDVEKIKDETALFHLFNMVVEQRGFLLLTSYYHPSALPWKLPDLCSRVNAVPTFFIDLPDEASIEMLLMKCFAERQLKVEKEVVAYMSKRVERSFSAVQQLIDRLERYSIEQKANLTIPFIRDMLAW